MPATTPAPGAFTETLLQQATVPAARFVIGWAPTTPIRTYLITETLAPAEVAAEVAEFAAAHDGSLAEIRLDLSMRVLTVQGVAPDTLVALASVFGNTPNAPIATVRDLLALARPASGLSLDTATACRDRGLDVHACAAWITRFPPGSLDTCLAAGCTGTELVGYLAAGALPPATETATLAALRRDLPATGPSGPAH